MRLLLSSDPQPQLTSTCTSQSCSWKPYSHSNDFVANSSLLLIILFSSLVCVLSLHAALRCCLRPIQQHDPKPDPEPEASQPDDPPTLVYSPGLDLAGNEVECIICLSEFQEGDTLRVLDRCKHGFHVQCIQKWLSSSHSSCPTCRASIFSSPPQLHSQSLPISDLNISRLISCGPCMRRQEARGSNSICPGEVYPNQSVWEDKTRLVSVFKHRNTITEAMNQRRR